jgi:DNA-binding XRE family transcriptional regulator
MADPKTVTDARVEIGAMLAGLRRAAGYTQETFAPLTHYGRSTIANIEIGRQVGQRGFWVRCDELLATGGVLTAEHDRIAQLRADHHRSLVWHVSIGSASGDSRTGSEIRRSATSDDDVRRPIALLQQIAGVVAASGLSVDASCSSRRVAMTDVARLTAITSLYRSVDREWGGGLLQSQLAYLAECATLWLEPAETISGTIRRRLMSAVADVRLLAGWVAFDSGCYEDSQRHFLLAERAAVSGGDNLMAARVRYCQARQFQHRRHNVDALHTLQFARHSIERSSTPALKALLLGAEAASQAALGNCAAAIRCLEDASEAFSDIDPAREPEWMDFYDRGELLAQYGRVYRDLARHDRAGGRVGVMRKDPGYATAAVDWVRQALAELGPANARSIMLNNVGLCSALMLANEPSQAIEAGSDLLTAARRTSSRRVVDRLLNLHRDFGPFHARSDVAEFGRELQTLRSA